MYMSAFCKYTILTNLCIGLYSHYFLGALPVIPASLKWRLFPMHILPPIVITVNVFKTPTFFEGTSARFATAPATSLLLLLRWDPPLGFDYVGNLLCSYSATYINGLP